MFPTSAQVFCVALWCLDEYWQYSLLTLAMLIVFEATIVKTRMRTLDELRRLGAPQQRLQALRDGRWAPVDPQDLVPGTPQPTCARPPANPLKNRLQTRVVCRARVSSVPRACSQLPLTSS